MWLVFAFGSALFAGLTSILAKCGIKKTDSDVATGIRTIIVLLFSWLMVFIVGSQNQISAIDGKHFYSLYCLDLPQVQVGCAILRLYRLVI